MKCPKCSQVFSDLRDICPFCLVDLRTRKRQLGLQVRFPNAEYDDLLRREKEKQRAQEEKQTGQFFDALKGLLGIEDPSPAATVQVESHSRQEVGQGATLQSEPEVERFQQKTYEAASSEQEEALTILEDPFTSQSDPAHLFDSSEEIRQPESPPHTSKAPSEKSDPATERTFVSKQKVGISLDDLISRASDQTSVPDRSPHFSAEMSHSDDRSLTLFRKAAEEVDQYQSHVEIDLDPVHFQNFSNRQDIFLMFTLAREALEGLDTNTLLSEKPAAKQVEKLSAKALQPKLDAALKDFDRPSYALLQPKQKSAKAKTPTKDAPPIVEQYRPASLLSRFFAFLIDLPVQVAVSCALALFFLNALFEAEFNEALLFQPTWSAIWVNITTVFLLSFLMTGFILRPTLIFILRGTLGMLLLGLEYRRIKGGGGVGVGRMLLRSLSLPLSYLLQSYLWPVFGGSPLHDWAAGIRLEKRVA